MTLKTLITVVLGAGALLVGAQSALAVPPDLSGNPNTSQGEPQWLKALQARSEGLNRIYRLGDYAVPGQYEKQIVVPQGPTTLYGLGDQSIPVVHDHGDATQAKLASQSSAKEGESLASYYQLVAQPIVPESNPVVVHDHGDAEQAKLDASSSRPELDSSWSFDWPQVGIGIGIGMLVLFGLFLTVRHTRTPVAH
jgi:hypothetical protein